MTQVEKACESFRVLLEEQLARVANMRTDKVDFAQKDVVTIGLVDGDGIGPIIMEQAEKVLRK